MVTPLKKMRCAPPSANYLLALAVKPAECDGAAVHGTLNIVLWIAGLVVIVGLVGAGHLSGY